MKRKLAALALSVSLISSMIAGCSSKPENTPGGTAVESAGTESAGGGTSLVISIDKDAPSLGPLNGFGSGVDYTRRQAFETLCSMNADQTLEYCIAKEIQEKGDGVYDIVLYDYVHDVENNPLKASDVVYVFDNAVQSGYYSSEFSTVEKYEAIDENTVELTFSNEKIGQLEAILCGVAMYTKAAYEASGDQMAQKPVGTKPYKLTDAVSGSYYTYEKTDNYWQTDEALVCTSSKSNVDTVKFTVITDETTAAIALQNGEIDKPSGVAAVDYGNFVDENWNSREGYTTMIAESNKVFHLVFNCSDNSPCADVNLRKAIAYCVDASTIAENIRGEMAYTVAGGLANQIWLDADKSKDPGSYYAFNLDTAKEYLGKSSYNGEEISLTAQNSSVHPTIATLIQAYCAEVGINVKVNVVETAVYNTVKNDASGTQFDILLGYEGAKSYYTWSANFALDVNTYGGETCLLGIHDEKLQSLFDAAASKKTASPENTKALLDYSEEMCYIYGLYANKNLIVSDDKVQNIVLDWDNNFISGACTVLSE